MFKKLSKLLFIFLVFYGFSQPSLVIGAQLEKKTLSHRAIFSWTLDPAITSQATYLKLKVDDQQKFDQIANQEQKNDSFILNLDYGTNQYQLIFDDLFPKGDHSWQIIGYDAQDKIIFETKKETFPVGQNKFSFYDFSLISSYVLMNTLDQLIALFLSVGTILFIFIFALFFFADFILTKGFLGLLSKKKPKKKGYVFNTNNNQNIPFALITVKGHNHNQEYIHKTSISDVYGIYDSIQVPKGKYTLVVRKQGYDFPTRKSRAQMINLESFYKGEEFEVTTAWKSLSPLIPLDPIITTSNKNEHKTNWQSKFWQKWRNLIAWQPFFELTLLILSVGGIYLQPSWLFVFTSFFYGLLVLKRAVSSFNLPTFYGLVVDEKGIEMTDAIVEVISSDLSNPRNFIKITDRKGQFSFSLSSGQYTINAQKNGYIAETATRTVNNSEEITINKKPTYKVIKLIPVPNLTEDFFLGPDSQDDLKPTV